MLIYAFYVIVVRYDESHSSLKFKSLELTGSYEERKEKTENKMEREIFHDISAVNTNGYLIHVTRRRKTVSPSSFLAVLDYALTRHLEPSSLSFMS